ncbi:MAG: helix-turn-helix transcriptional regulator [Mycobacteriaceae bacterium]
MSATAGRLLRLLALLQDGTPWTADELAAATGVPGRTLRRDIAGLKDAGYRITSTRGPGGNYRLTGGPAVPFLPTDGEEAVAVAVSLHAAARGTVGIDFPHGAASRAERRIRESLSPADRRDADRMIAAMEFSMGREPAVGTETVALLTRAITDHHEVTFTHTGKSGSLHRSVEPVRVVNLDHRWYLHGWDRDRRGWRTFRLDRIQDLTVTPNRFVRAPLPDGDIAAAIRGDFHGGASHTVVLELAAPPDIAAARLYRVDGTLEPVGDGDRTRYTAVVDSPEWLLTVLVIGDLGFTVVDPPEFADLVRAAAERFRRGAGPPTSSPTTSTPE